MTGCSLQLVAFSTGYNRVTTRLTKSLGLRYIGHQDQLQASEGAWWQALVTKADGGSEY